MDITKEASFEDALSSSVEEAINEFDDGDGNEEIEFENTTDDEPVELEQESEDVEDETELVADDESIDDETIEEESGPSAEKFKQTGNPNDLPPELNEVYKLMQGGMTKKSQEIAELKKHYEQLTQQLTQTLADQQKAQKAASRPPRPKNPTEGMSVEEQEERWREINEYDHETVLMRKMESGEIVDPQQFKQQQEQQKAKDEGDRRYQKISSMDGYDKDVEAVMMELVQTNPHWNAAVQTDEGAEACFEFAKTKLAADKYKLSAAELETQKIKRTAGASKRSTPKTSTQTKTASSKPIDNFANMAFTDKIDAIIGESFGI